MFNTFQLAHQHLVFLFPQNIHYTIHTGNTFTFQLTHQHLQFSSCHSVPYTIHTCNTVTFQPTHQPLQFSSCYACTVSLFPQSTHHTLRTRNSHSPTHTPTLTVFLLAFSVFLSTLCTVPSPKKLTALTTFCSSGCCFFVSASVFALGAMWMTNASKLPFLGVLSSSA